MPLNSIFSSSSRTEEDLVQLEESTPNDITFKISRARDSRISLLLEAPTFDYCVFPLMPISNKEIKTTAELNEHLLIGLLAMAKKDRIFENLRWFGKSEMEPREWNVEIKYGLRSFAW